VLEGIRMKKMPSTRKLVLDTQTIRQLDTKQLGLVGGAGPMTTFVSNNIQCQMESFIENCSGAL
jgi:hypothetical protein